MARIFLVDDDIRSAESTKRLLEIYGHTVVGISYSAKEALVSMGEVDFDIAIVDGLKGAGAFVAKVAHEQGKVIGLSASDVTFGDVNINKREGPQAVLAAIATLTKVSAEIEK